jgi:hypothetical protein
MATLRTFTWTAGLSNAWNTAGNWSITNTSGTGSASFPNGSQHVVIFPTSSGTYKTPTLSQNITVKSLTINGTGYTFELSSYNLNATDLNLNQTSTFNSTSGTLKPTNLYSNSNSNSLNYSANLNITNLYINFDLTFVKTGNTNNNLTITNINLQDNNKTLNLTGGEVVGITNVLNENNYTGFKIITSSATLDLSEFSSNTTLNSLELGGGSLKLKLMDPPVNLNQLKITGNSLLILDLVENSIVDLEPINFFIPNEDPTIEFNLTGNFSSVTTISTDESLNGLISVLAPDNSTFKLKKDSNESGIAYFNLKKYAEFIPNSAPTGIILSNSSINENNSIDDIIGTFTSTDNTDTYPFTYSLVEGTGDTENTSFTIDASGNLKANDVFNYETKNSYGIRVRSTDMGGLNYEEQFTITINNVNEAETTVEVSGNKIPQQTVDLLTGTSFTFKDPIAPSLIQSVKIFSGVGYLPLGDISANGLTVAIVNSSVNNKYIYAPVDASGMAVLGITGSNKLPMIFKVLDLSGNIQTNVSIPIEVYTDSNLGNVVQYDVSGTVASQSGVLVGQVGNKYKYTLTITKGNGWGQNLFSTATPSGGSDPHITTIFGKKYDFHPSTRRNYTLFKSKDMKVSSHFTGLKSGVYYDKVMIDLPNKEQVKVDFHSKQIKGKSSFVSMSEDSLPVKYENHTSNKSVGKIFEPRKMTKLSVAGKNPVDLFVDFQTRYVHFRFPETLPTPSEMSGLIVAPATRLD